MSADQRRAMIDRAAAVIERESVMLNELDSAIGDGDHGTNMTRGFKAIAEQGGELAAMAPGAALKKAGMTLVMKVGGASGPLYGSLLMGMAKAAGDAETVDLTGLEAALEEGIQAVKMRGKSDTGEKTMLDVLVPVSAALAAGREEDLSGPDLIARLVSVAEESLEATRPLLATKGRASFLGERSIGHLDPGAMSSCLLIKEVCAVLGDRQ